MGIFKKIAGLLGLANAKDDEPDGNGDDQTRDNTTPFRNARETGLPRKGFGVPVQIAVDRPLLPPILAPSTSADGGLQGLKWYAKRLRVDEDGDVADEFLEEVPPQTSALAIDQHKTVARYKLKYSTIPAKVKTQVLSDGKLQQCVEHHGRLQWV